LEVIAGLSYAGDLPEAVRFNGVHCRFLLIGKAVTGMRKPQYA
jgi:hypothetical protein